LLANSHAATYNKMGQAKITATVALHFSLRFTAILALFHHKLRTLTHLSINDIF
jgi:hypothetical protein